MIFAVVLVLLAISQLSFAATIAREYSLITKDLENVLTILLSIWEHYAVSHSVQPGIDINEVFRD